MVYQTHTIITPSIDKYSIDKNSISESNDSEKPSKPKKHKYGEYNNVLLTDEELDKIQNEYPDWKERIERLSSYVASTGKTYKSHYATIRNWARKDQEKVIQPVRQTIYQKQTKAEELDDFGKIKKYLDENKEYLSSAIGRLDNVEYNRIRYLSAILKNKLGDYKPKAVVKEVVAPKIQDEHYETKFKLKQRRGFEDLEDDCDE